MVKSKAGASAHPIPTERPAACMKAMSVGLFGKRGRSGAPDTPVPPLSCIPSDKFPRAYSPAPRVLIPSTQAWVFGRVCYVLHPLPQLYLYETKASGGSEDSDLPPPSSKHLIYLPPKPSPLPHLPFSLPFAPSVSAWGWGRGGGAGGSDFPFPPL